MNAIDKLFQDLRASKAKAFMPFVTAGDPNTLTSARIVREVVKCGANLVEIGIPYSDPIADGSVIQASYTRALAKGLRIEDVFAMIRGLADVPAPMVGMVSYSLVHHRGPERFIADAAEAGLAGLIVPDLPVEESGELAALARKRDFKLVQLVTPTTPKSRAVEILRQSTGFVYVVSVAGITGVRDQLPAELLEQLRWLRTQTQLPLCVGFGISKPEHIHMLRDSVDGVIVGSALVKMLEDAGKRPESELIADVGKLTATLSTALKA